MKSLLLVNQSSGYLMVDIVNAFVKSQKYAKIELFAGEIHIRPSVPDSSVEIIKTIKYNKKNIFTRLFSWVVAYLHLLLIVWTRSNKCELFLVSNPPLTSFVPRFTKKEYSILIYDLYPDSLYSQNFIKSNSIIGKLWKKNNIKVFSKARNIYTISEDMKKNVAQYVDNEKITVVNNWAHNEHLIPIKKEENIFLKEHKLQDKFIVLYSGNMGISHDIDIIVDIANKLKYIKNIHYIFIGDGAKKDIINRKIKQYGLDNCLVLPYQPMEILPHSMGCADIAVVTTDFKQTGLSVPSKTYSYLSTGASLLCLADTNSELGRLVTNNEIGMCFSSDNIDEIANYIIYLYNNQDVLNKFKLNSRQLSMYYTPNNAELYIK